MGLSTRQSTDRAVAQHVFDFLGGVEENVMDPLWDGAPTGYPEVTSQDVAKRIHVGTGQHVEGNT